MNTQDLQKLADLHFEAYDAMINLKLYREWKGVPKKMIEEKIDKYISAQREITKIINKYGTELFSEPGTGIAELETIVNSEAA